MDIPYELIKKPVKRITIRLKREDGGVVVTAPYRIGVKEIERLLQEKQEWIRLNQEKIHRHQQERKNWLLGRNLPSDEEILIQIDTIINAYLESLALWGIQKPDKIKLRTMKTLWGSCHHSKRVITINRILFLAPPKCQEYVILHELAHLAHPNHGKDFYHLLDQVQPDHRMRRKKLKDLALL